VNFSADFQRLLPVLAIGAAAVVAIAFVVRGLGGGTSGAGSAQQVLEDALGGGKGATSGKFQASLSVSLRGVPAQVAKPVDARFSGSFDEVKSGKAQLDLDGTVDAAGQHVSFGALSTGDRAFVKFRGKSYELPAGQLRPSGASKATSPLASLGVDPKSWFTNVRDAGSANVAGVPVEHLTADFDVGRAFADLQEVAARSEEAGQVSSSARQIASSVKQATVDLYTGKSDHILRKLTVAGRFEGSGPSGGQPLNGTVNFDLAVSDLNQPQRITAPRHAASIDELAGGALGKGRPAKAASPGGGTAARSHGRKADHRGTNRTRGSQRSGTAYVACVQGAQDMQALDKCQALLP
jgi:hypothetical protein